MEFGAGRSIRGIVTTDSLEGRHDVFLLILNAGVIHRVGPNRLSVRLARELAPDYLPSLRFDFSGLGDSPTRTDTTSIDDAIALDMAEAIEFLGEAYGARRFVTLGLCSGGREAFRGAYRDPRVCGAVMIDPYAYPTWTFHMKRVLPRIFRLGPWRSALSLKGEYLRELGGFVRGRPETSPEPNLDICGLPERPSPARMGKALDEVLARGTELLFVHTAGISEYYNYRNQLRDAFPAQFTHEGLRYVYMPDASHTFGSEDAFRELLGHLASWLSDLGLARSGGTTTMARPDANAGARGTA